MVTNIPPFAVGPRALTHRDDSASTRESAVPICHERCCRHKVLVEKHRPQQGKRMPTEREAHRIVVCDDVFTFRRGAEHRRPVVDARIGEDVAVGHCGD